MDNEKDLFPITELSDEELDNVVGGSFEVGDRVRMGAMIGKVTYCPKCSHLINSATGTVSGFRGVNSRGENVFFVKMDCCGYNYPGGLDSSMSKL